MRRILGSCLLLALAALGWLNWRYVQARREAAVAAHPVVVKHPVHFMPRTFDPANPPSDMPPLNPGELARTDSDFASSVHVSGQSRRVDTTRAVVTVTRIDVDLQLNLIIWAPPDAGPRIIDHENGHREIAEYYYQNADKIMERVADGFMGRQIEISGNDLFAEYTRALQTVAREMNSQYHQQIDPEPAQLLFDTITDHGRNGTAVKDAVAHALRNVSVEFRQAD
jgi:hypothetical protein